MKYNLDNITTPAFVIYEEKLRRNLELIKKVSHEAHVEIILAFKANAVWKLFPILREFDFGFAASSLNELKLGFEELGKLGHTYCLAYKEHEFNEYLSMSSYITFNSLYQWEKYKKSVSQWNGRKEHHVSPGLRVNPHCSVIETDLYNPALPGSRFGVNENAFVNLPDGIEGLHFHQLCESDSYDLEKVLTAFESQFKHIIPQLKWINMGGGHLMTREGYDIDHLIELLKKFKLKYPNVNIILEPGSAFMWQTGDLFTTVMDIVEDSGKKTAIIDSSFTCHMPDTLEMPYKPVIQEALEDDAQGIEYYIGGNSCLSGDFKGTWKFDSELKDGDRLTFKDMNHYTTVKTTMFNGLEHPSIVFVKMNGDVVMLREFDYMDYKSRMS